MGIDICRLDTLATDRTRYHGDSVVPWLCGGAAIVVLERTLGDAPDIDERVTFKLSNDTS